MAQDFLVEIGTEELPPTALRKLSNSFTDSIINSLKAEELDFAGYKKLLAAPRRLALVVNGLAEQTPEKEIVAWGPPAKIAFDENGKPSKAAEAFAKKNGISIDELKTENDGKADKLVFRSIKPGKAVTELLPAIVQNALDKLPIPKRMRWGASRTEFVRPAHWIVMLYGSDVVEGEVLGIKTGNTSRGHRFHCNEDIILSNASGYEQALNDAHVVVSFEQRLQTIKEQVTAEGKKVGGDAVITAALLDEVTALNEWPVALTGGFEERFLSVPAEALISSMAEHQKYFHVVDNNGDLMPHFITVANIESTDPAQVISGNERVIRPRLADAAFFFETDKKIKLAERVEKLQSVVFQAKLGTLLDKAQRVKALAEVIAGQLNSNVEYAGRAAQLCKADLVSDMVLEFDKMQGIAGTYYALNDGEPEEVANAIQDHYLPKFSGDKLPETLTGCAVALADRLDTIVGIFGIGQPPTGSKDPFALRRATLGVLRIIVEKNLDLDLRELLQAAQDQHGELPAANGLADTVLDYMIERFRAWYEEDNIAPEIFMAVSAKGLSQPLDINSRVKAVHSFSQLPEAQALAAANKRVSNILAKLDSDAHLGNVDNKLLNEGAEKTLAELVHNKTDEVAPLFAERQYTEALASLASLRVAVDCFFDDVMVMVDDEALRNNRLALLKQLRGLFLEVADISLLVPAK
jgi:glycyl-tRNA synthetase beta chain